MLFEHKNEELFTLNRSDAEQPLSSYALFSFELDGAEWPSVEHYYQAMKFEDEAHREKIRQAKVDRDKRRAQEEAEQCIDWKLKQLFESVDSTKLLDWLTWGPNASTAQRY